MSCRLILEGDKASTNLQVGDILVYCIVAKTICFNRGMRRLIFVDGDTGAMRDDKMIIGAVLPISFIEALSGLTLKRVRGDNRTEIFEFV